MTTTCSFNVDTWQAGQGLNAANDEYAITNGTPFQEYWDLLPSLRTNITTALTVDGHSFQGRMAVLKLLMFEMDDSGIWGENREWHWLWGYASQLDWQHRSGRLAVGGGADKSDTISTQSWWSYMNFCFSICILLGAEHAGILNGIECIQLDQASQELVSNDTAVQQCISSWQHLFEHGYQDYIEAVKDLVIPSKEFGDARFHLQQQVWIAHTDVIQHTIGHQDSSNVVSPRAAELLKELPQPEQDFGLGWCHMVEIIAACTFPTDLVSLLDDGAGFLPLQVVTQERWNEWQQQTSPSDVDARRFHSVQVTHKLLDASTASLGRMASFWQRVVRTNDVSRAMPETIKQLAHGTTRVKLQQLSLILYLYVRPRGTLEWSIVVAFLSIFSAATVFHNKAKSSRT